MLTGDDGMDAGLFCRPLKLRPSTHQNTESMVVKFLSEQFIFCTCESCVDGVLQHKLRPLNGM